MLLIALYVINLLAASGAIFVSLMFWSSKFLPRTLRWSGAAFFLVRALTALYLAVDIALFGAAVAAIATPPVVVSTILQAVLTWLVGWGKWQFWRQRGRGLAG